MSRKGFNYVQSLPTARFVEPRTRSLVSEVLSPPGTDLRRVGQHRGLIWPVGGSQLTELEQQNSMEQEPLITARTLQT